MSASLDGYVSSSQTAIAILEGQTQVLDFTLEAEDAPPPPPPPPPGGALVNGDFSRSLEGWNVWTERGELGPVAANGVVHLVGRGHNGGIYQQFQTGGAGAEVTVEGFWESRPSVANAQWAEVLVIDGARLPSDGNDLSAAEADVVMIYKNDTWATPNGWSGNMRNHAPVASVGSFVASSDVATIVLKSGNLLGVDSGVVFDDIEVGTPASPPPVNQPPIARLVATPSDGNVPLDVSFDASSSSDPDGDGLSFDWNFGDGASGTGETSSHRYDNAGLYTVVVTVDDGWGGTDAASTTVEGGLAAPVDNLVANGDFSLGLEGWSFWRERGAVTPVVEGGQAQRRSLPTVRDGRRGPRDHGGRVLGFRAHRRGIAVGGDSRDRWSGLTYRGSGFEWSPAERDSVTQARHVGFAVGMERGDGAGELRLIGGRGDDRAQERQRSGGEYWNDLRRHRRSRRELDPAASSIPPPVDSPPGIADWDQRLTSLGLEVVQADVPAGTSYWKLVSAGFESDGEILPPPGGGSESGGTHSIYIRSLDPNDAALEGQPAVVSWPAANEATVHTKGTVDQFWGDFPMAGGWCPFYPDGPRGPYAVRMGEGASDEVRGMGMPCNRHVSYRFVWKWTRKESGKSKLSIHAGFGGPRSMAFVRDAKPRIVKILDTFSAAPEVKRLSPETEIIGRAFLAEQPMDGDPGVRAREWWDRTKGLVAQYPAIDYWEGYNEPIIQTPELMEWYAAFEAERVGLLADAGSRACIGNFSVGNPDLPLWPHFYAAIDAAIGAGGILGLHEYGTPMQQHFDETSGEGWFAGRYRKLYRQYLIPAGKVIPLAITEAGSRRGGARGLEEPFHGRGISKPARVVRQRATGGRLRPRSNGFCFGDSGLV